MKINLVLPHQLPFPPTRGGGVENLNWMLAREFAARGHEVVAYSRSIAGLPLDEVDVHRIRHIRLGGYDLLPNRLLDHWNALRYARKLRGILQAAQITSFHTPFSFLFRGNALLGACAHTIHRTPKLQVFLYRALDRVYCGSDAVVAQARKIDRKITNLKRIHNCIALEKEPARAPVRNAGDGLLFLYVGRFVPDKGIASLIQGLELSLGEFPCNRLETIGPQQNEGGGDTRFFRKMSRYLRTGNLSQHVNFRPPVYDRVELNALIAAADVICVPSLSGETFSMAILEAMALAKPVLVSDFSPMTEAVDHKVTGYIATAGDAASIAGGIRFFSANPANLATMGRAGFEKAQRGFSVEKVASEYLEDFSVLIARRETKNGVLLTSPDTILMKAENAATEASRPPSPWSVGFRIRLLLWEACWSLLCSWTPKPFNGWRLVWLRIFGAKIHGTPFVHQRARIQIPWHLTLQDRCCLGDRTNAYSLGEIVIGPRSVVAQEAYLCTGSHDFSNPLLPLTVAKVTIGADAFIGARAFVMPGLQIGDRAIIGACAVVTRDVNAGEVVAGNPARVVNHRF